MALESKAIPEGQFNAWLAEHAPVPNRPPRLQQTRFPVWIRVVALVVGLFLWIALLSCLGAEVRQLLQILKV